MRRLFSVCFAGIVLNAAAFAGTLLFWDIENPQRDPQTSEMTLFQATSFNAGVTGFASHTGGGGAEQLNAAEGYVLMTRYAGSWYQPYIDFTATVPVTISDLAFQHNHNHNGSCCATVPGYWVQLQLDSGSGFGDIGAPFYAQPANDASTTTIDLNLQLQPGTYKIRWYVEIPGFDPYGGHSTNTDYFGLNDISLDGSVPTPEPATLLLMGAGGLLILWRRWRTP